MSRAGHARNAWALVACAAGCTSLHVPIASSPPEATIEAPRGEQVSPAALTVAHVEAASAIGRRRWDNVIQVTEHTQEAVQRALDAAHGRVIVVLAAGHYSIRGTLDVRGDDVLVVGAGAGSMSLGSPADADATVLERSSEREDAERLVPMIRARASKRVQVSGIRFEGVTAEGSKSKDIGVLLEDADEFRVDHCYFSHMGFAGVRVNGASRGVVDHSSFDAEYKAAIGTEGYGVAVYGSNAILGIPMGAAATGTGPSFAATFVEDCSFSLCRHAIASNKGARYVFRKNRVASGVVAHAVDAHGTEYASEIGTEWIDVYDNTIEQAQHSTPFYDGWAIRMRGGQGLIHDNTIRGYSTGVELTELTSEKTGPVFIWNNVLTPAGGRAVHADRPHQKALPTYALSAPAGYVPHAYPHPLSRTSCVDEPRTRVGWSYVCAAQ